MVYPGLLPSGWSVVPEAPNLILMKPALASSGRRTGDFSFSRGNCRLDRCADFAEGCGGAKRDLPLHARSSQEGGGGIWPVGRVLPNKALCPGRVAGVSVEIFAAVEQRR
jgi:hypothetical protein